MEFKYYTTPFRNNFFESNINYLERLEKIIFRTTYAQKEGKIKFNIIDDKEVTIPNFILFQFLDGELIKINDNEFSPSCFNFGGKCEVIEKQKNYILYNVVVYID